MSNLNTIFGGDASGIVAASKQAKSAVKDFTRTTDQAMSALGDAFGVNTAKIEQLTNAAKGLGLKLSGSSNQGVAAFGKLLGSINAVGMGLAGLGVGAVVAAFKTLNAEAMNFSTTIAGAKFDKETAAYLQTYSQVLHDFNSDTGKAIQGWKNGIKETFAELKGEGTWLSGRLFGSGTTRNEFKQQSEQAKQAATTAKQLTGEIYDLELKRMKASSDMLQLDNAIAQKQAIIRDTSVDSGTRARALADARELINQKYSAQIALEKGIYDRMKTIDDLAENTLEETQATVNQHNKVLSLEIAQQNELNALVKAQNSIAKGAKEEATAREKSANEAMKLAGKLIEMQDSKLENQLWAADAKSVTPIQPGKAVDNSGLMGFADYGKQIQKYKDYSQEVTATVVEGVSIMSDAIGGLIGDLATGGDAWKNFGNVALGSFADMMQSVGKLVMKEGIAVTAVWKSLTDPTKAPLAIAAGAALVAIGASIKAGLSNVASGSYSASSGVATGGYSSASPAGGYSGREMNIHVTGTLQASGSQLVAVLNNENRRTKSTT